MQVTVDLKYQNYIFDLYGTLIDIHTDEEDKIPWMVISYYYRQHGAGYYANGIRTKYKKYL